MGGAGFGVRMRVVRDDEGVQFAEDTHRGTVIGAVQHPFQAGERQFALKRYAHFAELFGYDARGLDLFEPGFGRFQDGLRNPYYLVGVSGTSLAGEWIPFREFEGGTAYIGSFSDRSLAPLKKAFGDRPDHLVPAGEPLGAEPLELGDVGVRVPVFPKVPLAVILWRGDDEFPPEVNILYDKTANSILHTEDLAICGALTVSKLRKNAETMRKEE